MVDMRARDIDKRYEHAGKGITFREIRLSAYNGGHVGKVYRQEA